MTASLSGQIVLLAEDEFLVSALLTDSLEAAGAVVLGPATTLAEALRLAGQGGYSCAVLDWNLGGERSDPLARLLVQRGVPFVIATGYGNVPAEFSAAPILTKPFDQAILIALLARHTQGDQAG